MDTVGFVAEQSLVLFLWTESELFWVRVWLCTPRTTDGFEAKGVFWVSIDVEQNQERIRMNRKLESSCISLQLLSAVHTL